MRREELTALFAAYERDHPVETYEAYGHGIWPMLRVLLGLAAHGETQQFKSGGAVEPASQHSAGLTEKLTYTGRTIAGLATDLLADTVVRVSPTVAQWPTPHAGPRDVVLMTHSNRVERTDDGAYHRIVDPLVEHLAAIGRSWSIWESGPAVDGRVHAPVSITERLAREAWVYHRRGVLPRTSPEPAWFANLSDWARGELELSVAWPTFDRYARQVALQARVIERWLRRVECRLLLLDCWYSLPHLAAGLAAARLGLRSVDVQHGLQGAGHFGYSGWTRAPAQGYETFPQAFWLWGADDERNHLETNPTMLTPDQLVTGGNAWLNLWRQPGPSRFDAPIRQARQLAADAERVVLVTLQKDLDFEETLAAIIADSPAGWRWWLRLRLNMTDRAPALATRLRATGHPGVNIDDATRLPLYALMRAADLHVTWFSTCALEALAFGVPTVLLHPSGESAFAPYVADGLMQYAAEPPAFPAAAVAMLNLPSEQLTTASERVFAPPGSASAALDQLLGIKARG